MQPDYQAFGINKKIQSSLCIPQGFDSYHFSDLGRGNEMEEILRNLECQDPDECLEERKNNEEK